MSYDLFLFRPPPGADPLDAARAAYDDEAPDTMPAPGWRERMRPLADALVAADPALRAETFGEGSADARIGLSEGADSDTGLQVELYPGMAFVTLPYHHTGADVLAAWERAWRCVAVLERMAGLRTYDPQRERVLDLATDLDAVLAEYADGVADLRFAIANQLNAPPPARRPWWKLWG